MRAVVAILTICAFVVADGFAVYLVGERVIAGATTAPRTCGGAGGGCPGE